MQLANSPDELAEILVCLGTSPSCAKAYVRRLTETCEQLGYPRMFLSHSTVYWLGVLILNACSSNPRTIAGNLYDRNHVPLVSLSLVNYISCTNLTHNRQVRQLSNHLIQQPKGTQPATLARRVPQMIVKNRR